jgi:hypothetical protein
MIAYATRSIFERFAYRLYRLDFKDLHQAACASIAISLACMSVSQRDEMHCVSEDKQSQGSFAFTLSLILRSALLRASRRMAARSEPGELMVRDGASAFALRAPADKSRLLTMRD